MKNYRNLKYTNPYGQLVGFFTEGETQEEADTKFFQDLPQKIETLNQLQTEMPTLLLQEESKQ